MKDSTKHIIAKEIYFFFKWFIRGFGLGIILGFLSIPLVRYFTGDTHTPWFATMLDDAEITEYQKPKEITCFTTVIEEKQRPRREMRKMFWSEFSQ